MEARGRDLGWLLDWTVGAIVAAAVFFGMGLFRDFLGEALRDEWRSRTVYQPVEAVVLDGELEAIGTEPYVCEHGHHHEANPHYRVALTLGYEADGNEYAATAYPGGEHWTDRRTAEAELARYEPGEALTAWRDPEAPDLLRLSREGSFFTWVALLWAIGFPLFFALFAVSAARQVRLARRRVRGAAPAGPEARLAGDGAFPHRLEQRQEVDIAPFLIIFALMWNGLLCAMLAQTWRETGWFNPLTFCLLPFIAVGVGLAAGAVGSVLARLTPPTVVELDRLPGRAGDLFTLRVSQRGGADLSSLRVLLTARRELDGPTAADYHTAELHAAQPGRIPRGEWWEERVTARLPEEEPADLGDNERLAWSVVVQGSPRRRPRFRRVFPLLAQGR